MGRRLLGSLRWLVAAAVLTILVGTTLVALLGFAIDDTADCSHEDQHDCRMIHDMRRNGLIGAAVSAVAGAVLVVWWPGNKEGEPPGE
jgi:hypothetical protein